MQLEWRMTDEASMVERAKRTGAFVPRGFPKGENGS